MTNHEMLVVSSLRRNQYLPVSLPLCDPFQIRSIDQILFERAIQTVQCIFLPSDRICQPDLFMLLWIDVVLACPFLARKK